VRTLVLALALALSAAPKKKEPAPRPPPPADAPTAQPALAPAKPPDTTLGVLTPAPRRHAAQGTACGSCHTTASWSASRFDHSRTGFLLEGKHTSTSCKACHPVDFQRSVPASCSGCHLDVHVGELGARCEGCHDPHSWKSRFPADAHRLTGFPLVGRHAALPCSECHFTEAAGRFSRAASGCAACHQADADRTVGTAVDHAARGFSPNCQQCHQGWSFRPARFSDHDTCFVINSGGHSGLSCRECHSDLSVNSSPGTCNTGTSTCISCHEHTCAKSDPQHANVLGYRCADQRCAECHKERP
jgi:Cytochrome c7 and related cytochrome c